MKNILLFIKDFELGSKVSSACVDYEMNVEFCDENTSPDDFANKSILAIIDLEEDVFFSVGLVSELKRHELKIIGSLKCSQGGHRLTHELLKELFKDQNNYSLIEIKGEQLPHIFTNYQNLKSIA